MKVMKIWADVVAVLAIITLFVTLKDELQYGLSLGGTIMIIFAYALAVIPLLYFGLRKEKTKEVVHKETPK